MVQAWNGEIVANRCSESARAAFCLGKDLQNLELENRRA